MQFSDLDFVPHHLDPNGVKALVFFDNGYCASVIRVYHSYGQDEGLYELAVGLKTGEGVDDWDLCYDTPITDDVIGHLTEERVTELLQQIEALPTPN